MFNDSHSVSKFHIFSFGSHSFVSFHDLRICCFNFRDGWIAYNADVLDRNWKGHAWSGEEALYLYLQWIRCSSSTLSCCDGFLIKTPLKSRPCIKITNKQSSIFYWRLPRQACFLVWEISPKCVFYIIFLGGGGQSASMWMYMSQSLVNGIYAYLPVCARGQPAY